MTPLDGMRAALCLRHGPPMAWDTCRALLQFHMAPTRDVVAVLDPRSMLARQLAEAVEADRLFLHGAAPQAAPQAGPQDRDRAGVRRPWPAAARRGAKRLRRLDTLYASSHAVGLIVLDTLEDPVAVLAGATGLLDAHHPHILLDVAAIPPAGRGACLAAMRAALPGYRWHDSWLLSLPDGAAVEGAAMLTAETVFALLPPDPAALPQPGLAWQGWRTLVRPSDTAQLDIVPDAAFATMGFYPPETDGHITWRWSGPDAAARFWLPVPSYGIWRIAIEVFSWGEGTGADNVQISLGGAKLEPARFADGALRLGPVPVLPTGGGPLIQVDLACARMRPNTVDDPRTLGVCISRCVLEREV